MPAHKITCPSCKAVLNLPEHARGKRARCPKCKAPIQVPGPAEAGPEWLLARDKQRVGPFSVEQLRRMARAGELKPDDMVRRTTDMKWGPAARIHGLFAEPKVRAREPEQRPIARAPVEATAWEAGSARAFTRPRRSGSRTPLLIGGGAALMAVAGFLLYFFVFRKTDEPKSTEVAGQSGPQKPGGSTPPVGGGTSPQPGTPSTGGARAAVDLTYVSPNFHAAVVVNAQKLLKSPLLKSLPFDQIDADPIKMGVDPRKIEQVLILFEITPTAEALFSISAVVRYAEPMKIQEFVTTVLMGKEAKLQDKIYYKLEGLPNGPHAILIPDPRTLVITQESLLPQMLILRAAKSPLAEQLATLDVSHDIAAALVLDEGAKSTPGPSLRGFLTELAKSGPVDLPPELAELKKLPERLQAVTLTVDLSGDPLLKLDVALDTPESAKPLVELANSQLQLLKTLYPQLKPGILAAVPPPHAEVIGPVLDDLVAGIAVEQQNNHVVARIKKPKGFDQLLTEAGKMLPLLLAAGAPSPNPVPPEPGKDHRSQGIEWVRENNAFGPDHKLVKDVEEFLTKQVKDGLHFYQITLGAELAKSGKATILVGYRRKIWTFELTEEQAVKFDKGGMLRTMVKPQPDAGPVGVEFEISNPVFDGGTTIRSDAEITGKLPFRLTKPRDSTGYISIRLTYWIGNTKAVSYSHYKSKFVGKDDKEFNFKYRSFKEDQENAGGPIVFLFDLVEFIDDQRTGDPFVVSNPVAVLVNVVPVKAEEKK